MVKKNKGISSKVKKKEQQLFYFYLKKKKIIILFLILANLFVAFLIVSSVINFFEEKVLACGDGSFYSTCSLNQPYFCEDGFLVERSSICGCFYDMFSENNSCFSKLSFGEKNLNLSYMLDGKKKYIDFLAYNGTSSYLSHVPRNINYAINETPSRLDFKLKKINEPKQRIFLLPLAAKIQNLTNNKNEQAKIAISLVQNIPFGKSNKSFLFNNKSVAYSRYPYEVLYDQEGICGEKSELLAFLLRDLGFGVVIFYNSQENHEAVGVKCPLKYSWENSGYCFVETSGPALISDYEIIYEAGFRISSNPEIMLISDGISFSDNLEEYEDARDFMKLREKISKDGKLGRFDFKKLEKIKEKYGLVDVYWS